MKLVIIEDEELVALELEQNIRKLMDIPLTIVHLRSVKESIQYFEHSDLPDLIFSDIQLGDGLSFEIFVETQIAVPVIFCTAYDEYALDAFKTNGIDYILKPFTMQMLDAALNKYKALKQMFSTDQTPQYDALLHLLNIHEEKKTSSILVHHKDKIIPVKTEDIAICYLKNEIVHMVTFSGACFYPNKNLDELERSLGTAYFRANRQVLVCRNTIIDVSNFFSRKLSLNLKIPIDEKVIVSKAKSSQFLEWLSMG